jgi:hypothetical protein
MFLFLACPGTKLPFWPGFSGHGAAAAEGDASELMEGSASWQRANSSSSSSSSSSSGGPLPVAELAAQASVGGATNADLAVLAPTAGASSLTTASHGSAGNLAAAAAALNAGAAALGVATTDSPFYRGPAWAHGGDDGGGSGSGSGGLGDGSGLEFSWGGGAPPPEEEEFDWEPPTASGEEEF